MQDARFDLYTLVHKGQRLKLFELATRAGRLGARDAANREALHADLRTLLDMVHSHAESEDLFVGPLLAACAPAEDARLRATHAQIDRRIAEMRSALDEAGAAPTPRGDSAVYRALCRFAALYLRHVDAEEHVAQPALWAAYDDARLAAVHAAIIAAQDPGTVAYNLRCMLPAATPEERVGLLSGFKRRLPPPAFAGIRASVESLLAREEWRAVDAAA